jgi:hypothetical protein
MLNPPLRLRKLIALSSHRAEVSGEGWGLLWKKRLLGILLCLVTSPQDDCLQCQAGGNEDVVTTDDDRDDSFLQVSSSQVQLQESGPDLMKASQTLPITGTFSSYLITNDTGSTNCQEKA